MEINKNSDFFKQLITNPNLVKDDVINELITQYPYCTAFWFVKSVKTINEEDQRASTYFQQAALLSSHSELLYRFINKYKFYVETINQEKSSTQKADPIINKEQDNVRQKPSLYHDDSMPYSFIWWLNKTRVDHASTYQPYVRKESYFKITTDSNAKDPLDQQMLEHIFHIQAPELKLSDENISKTVPFKVSRKENLIIEKFINEEPQITPPSPEKVSLENKARKSAVDESGFVSETLARIYTEQGLYHKAIDTYKKLSLKFPEKSLYFADLIKQLEKQN